MSKQVMQRALDALEGADAIDTDMADAIAELRAAINAKEHQMDKQLLQQALDFANAMPMDAFLNHGGRVLAQDLRVAIDAPEVEPAAFLADATRFKVRGDEDSEACRIYGIPHELNGRWVALVAADDNCHLKLTTPPDTEAQVRGFTNQRIGGGV